MGKMSLLQSSCRADDSCVVFCRSQANLLLKAVNPKFEATLLRVYDKDGEVYYIWADINPQNDETSFCTVFAGEMDAIPPIEDAKPIEAGEVFNHEDCYYAVVQNKVKDVIIRCLTVLSNEQMLYELLADDEDFEDISSVSLVKLFAIGHGKEFLTLAWSVVCEGAITYLPVLDQDVVLLDEYNIGALLKEQVSLGMPVKLHEYFYTPLQDDNGQLYIERSKNPRFIPQF